MIVTRERPTLGNMWEKVCNLGLVTAIRPAKSLQDSIHYVVIQIDQLMATSYNFMSAGLSNGNSAGTFIQCESTPVMD